MNYNKFIDFNKLFFAIIEENTEELNKHQYESDTYGKILRFIDTDYKRLKLDIDECEFDDDYIFFVFGRDFNDANESNSQSGWANYTIKFDRILNEFTLFECEAG